MTRYAENTQVDSFRSRVTIPDATASSFALTTSERRRTIPGQRALDLRTPIARSRRGQRSLSNSATIWQETSTAVETAFKTEDSGPLQLGTGR